MSTPFASVVIESIELGSRGCWLWTGYVTPDGYGRWGTGKGRTGAHRWAYREWVGPIPAGLVIDHLCHDPKVCAGGPACDHRRCVNPAHLAAVTKRENDARTTYTAMTHCKRGHEFTPENTYTGRGVRQCRACQRAAVAAYRARRRAS